MSKDNTQTNQFNNIDDEDKYGAKHKPWNYPDLSNDMHRNQNRTCCSPVDEMEAMENDENYVATHNVEVQTDKSTLFLLKQDKRMNNSLKKSNQEVLDNKKMQFLDNSNCRHYQTNEFENIKLRKTGLNYENDKIRAKLSANINNPEVFYEYAETDLDQPMDYTLCYNETNLDEEKRRRNTSYLHKNDLVCIEEAIEEEKVEVIKPKGAFNKEPTKNKKEMFSNTSRSFKEIFNFFKDRDKKRSTTENAKMSTSEGQKLSKTTETYEQKIQKSSQLLQPPVERYEKEPKVKIEAQYSQQTPLMFSRCSSLGSLNGFEQNSINDDRSSIVSDFSRRTSGVVSPSELLDSPAQTTLSGNKLQQKPQIGCFGKKKIQSPHQDKLKVCQNLTPVNDNTLQNECNIKMLPVAKRSVFEDNLTSFKDESTPTKLHSMAASSLSSLTIDDEDDFEIVNKIVLNKEKQNVIEEAKIQNNRQEPIGEPNLPANDSLVKLQKTEIITDEQEEDLNDEKNDELTDLTPYEEQLLDECIRRGIAKWTKQNINEIKPFSWDAGLTCRATRMILTSRIRVNSFTDIDNDIIQNQKSHRSEISPNSNLKYDKNSQSMIEEFNSYEKYSNRDCSPTEQVSDLEKANDQFNESSYYITYEEHLLDQCIRRGMAKITRRHINNIKPFSWDANQICLTTRAMMLHGRDEDIYGCH